MRLPAGCRVCAWLGMDRADVAYTPRGCLASWGGTARARTALRAAGTFLGDLLRRGTLAARTSGPSRAGERLRRALELCLFPLAAKPRSAGRPASAADR